MTTKPEDTKTNNVTQLPVPKQGDDEGGEEPLQ